MADNINPLAPHVLPPFLAEADGSDWLMTGTIVGLVAAVFGVGVFFLFLHSLPERRLHGREKVQFEIVAVLCLLALFTHNHMFWVAALILGMIHIPDFGQAFDSMAGSLSRIAGWRRGAAPPEPAPSGPATADAGTPPPADPPDGGAGTPGGTHGGPAHA